MKVKRNISIDQDLDDALKRNPWINVSALANLLLREYIEEHTDELVIETPE